MKAPYAIHWFRRDLRIAGNPALQRAFREQQGRVVGVFCFDQKFLARPDFSAVRFQFFLQTLQELRRGLTAAGSDLLILDVGPLDAFPALLAALSQKPAAFYWNRDYEPFARERDRKMEEVLRGEGIQVFTERDHLLIEPQEVYKGSDPAAAYQVFTPFSRRWLEIFETEPVKVRLEAQKKGIRYLDAVRKEGAKKVFQLNWKQLLGSERLERELLEEYLSRNGRTVSIPLPAPGALAGLAQLRAFKKKIEAYGDTRDYPALAGTSRLSIYFKNGSLTVPQVIAELGLTAYGKKEKDGKAKFLSELIWREFYYSILFRFPDVEHRAFQPRFENIKWQNREDWFEAWKEGRTGFPIVDAGMRELNTTGLMHNRVRMIVASFLTKDLLIDWKWGERYFMERLLDGDLAPNNGGWQWAASTGCDAQPYFRIFNPYLQSARFDPQGQYIHKYIPELRHLSGDDLHQPPPRLRGEYPAPLVEHSVQREKALKMYS